MGDASIASALREGVNEAVKLLGESITFTRAGPRTIDPTKPNEYRVSQIHSATIEATVADVENHLIDGNLVKLGDKVVTFTPTYFNEPLQKIPFVPQIGDRATAGDGVQLSVHSVNTNRIAGEDVSYEVILR